MNSNVATDDLLEYPTPIDVDWEEAVRAGIEARQAADKGRWELGDLALTVETQYGGHRLEEFAARIEVGYETLRRYRSVSQAFEIGTRVPDLTWTHHRAVEGHPERWEWLQQAAEERWSVSTLQNEVRRAELRPHQERVVREERERAERLADLRQDVAQQIAEGTSPQGVMLYLDSLLLQPPDGATQHAARRVQEEFRIEQIVAKRPLPRSLSPSPPLPTPPSPAPVSEEVRRLKWRLDSVPHNTDALMDQDPADVVAALAAGFTNTPVVDESLKGILQRRDALDTRVTLIVQWLEEFLKELRR